MNIMVINAGSSSLKYQLLDIKRERNLAKGVIERIGLEHSILKHQPEGKNYFECEIKISDHSDAVICVLEALVDKDHGVLLNINEIGVVGHEACKKVLPEVMMVGVFDTVYHQTMPQKAFLYGLPMDAYEKHKVRRYGFHGISHQYVVNRAARILGKPGKGHLPWREICEALIDINYEGNVVMEPFVRNDGLITQCVRVWRDMSENADEDKMDNDAVEALAFFRYVLNSL